MSRSKEIDQNFKIQVIANSTIPHMDYNENNESMVLKIQSCIKFIITAISITEAEATPVPISERMYKQYVVNLCILFNLNTEDNPGSC